MEKVTGLSYATIGYLAILRTSPADWQYITAGNG